MSLLVTGSIGIDTIRTPHGVSERCLGGSAVYFSMAASFFSPVRFVGVVGADCPFNLKKVFKGGDVDLAGLEVRQDSKTFCWSGSYQGAMNEATTDDVALNVLAEAPPKLPDSFKDSKFIFLANTAPALQRQLLEQLDGPTLAVADTMNLWIENNHEDFNKLLGMIDVLIFNDAEARMLTGEFNLIKAADKTLSMGPRMVVIKKGEHGSLICSRDKERFILPAYPTDNVKDPTGAGDSFAGALMGYLAKTGKSDFETLKKAAAYGTVLSSFTIEDFSLDRLGQISRADIEERFARLQEMTRF